MGLGEGAGELGDGDASVEVEKEVQPQGGGSQGKVRSTSCGGMPMGVSRELATAIRDETCIYMHVYAYIHRYVCRPVGGLHGVGESDGGAVVEVLDEMHQHHGLLRGLAHDEMLRSVC